MEIEDGITTKFNDILLIDDDDATCMILKIILSKSDIVKKFNFCLGGQEALDYLEISNQNSTFPEAIFVDLNMPGMDGYEFLEIYQHKFYSSYIDTKVIVVTSSMRTKDREKSLSFACVTKFVNKPLTIDKIKEI